MKILTILGTPNKGNTRAIVDLFLKEFEDGIILPRDMPEFCYDCANCI